MLEEHVRSGLYGADALSNAPDWEAGGRVHNWRNHIGEHTKAVWPTLTENQRLAIILDADDAASNEQWD